MGSNQSSVRCRVALRAYKLREIREEEADLRRR